MRASREVLLRLVVVHPDRKALDLFARELGLVGISFAPGTKVCWPARAADSLDHFAGDRISKARQASRSCREAHSSFGSRRAFGPAIVTM